MLDTMIYDAVIEHPDVLERLRKSCADGKLVVLSTHIQEDQLADIPDPEKHQAVLDIPAIKVPTSAAIWNLSRWGECNWGDQATESKIAAIEKGNPKHAPDALIGATASSVADAFVTNDRQFATRLKAADANVLVWNFGDFAKFLETL